MVTRSPLIITTRYRPFVGGQEQATETLARELVSRGDGVAVLTETLGQVLPLRESFDGVEIVRIRSGERRTFAAQVNVAWKTARFVFRNRRRLSWILIRTYSASAAAIGLMKMFRLLDVPTMVTSDTGGSADDIRALESYRMKRLFVRLISAHDHLNALNADNLRSLRDLGFPEDKVTHIANGIDVGAWRSSSRPASVSSLACIGRVEREKGVFVLLEAFAKVLIEYPSATLDFIGDGSSFQALATEVSVRGLSDSVLLRGALPHDELQKAYASYDGVVIPSPAEGFCLVAYEAMAHRRIVIATDVADLREVFGNAIIICDTPSPEGLAAGMLTALRGDGPDEDTDGAVLGYSVEAVTASLVKVMSSD